MVLYVGHIAAAKGAFDLVHAFAAARHGSNGARLVMVGDGSALDECREMAHRLTDTISFVGAQPHERISTWLAACDLLALPSWNEGMPNVVYWRRSLAVDVPCVRRGLEAFRKW